MSYFTTENEEHICCTCQANLGSISFHRICRFSQGLLKCNREHVKMTTCQEQDFCFVQRLRNFRSLTSVVTMQWHVRGRERGLCFCMISSVDINVYVTLLARTVAKAVHWKLCACVCAFAEPDSEEGQHISWIWVIAPSAFSLQNSSPKE